MATVRTPFSALLSSVYTYFVECFCPGVCSGYWSAAFSFLIVSWSDFDISVKVILASSNEFGIVPFLPNVWKFEEDWY